MSVDYAPKAVLSRLRRVAELTDLRTENRLRAKIDYSPEAVLQRLRQVEAARRACMTLGAASKLGAPKTGE